MTSRTAILAAVRHNQPPPAPLPEPLPVSPVTGEAAARFREIVRAIGGDVVDGDVASVDEVIATRFPEAAVIAATVAGVTRANLELAAVRDPHELADLDLLVCRAVLGVAENGALWLPAAALGHPAAAFLAQHVLVLLDAGAIVQDMHEAYARVSVAAEGFSLFMAGPSKTADIEQALVIGAHGPRSLTIVLTGGR